MTSTTPRQSALEEGVVAWFGDQPLLGARLPVSMLTKAEKAVELQRVVAAEAMTAAYKAELVLGLADDTSDTDDPAPGTPGARQASWAPDTELPGVSEFFTAELATVLNCGRGTASHLARRAWTYRESLPATWAALAAGTLDEARAKVLADVLERAAPAVARAIEAELLPRATEMSTGKLRKLALAALIARDAGAVDQRREQAQRQADVRCHASPLEGMSTLAADLPAEQAAACHDVLDRLARMLKADGDERPIGQLRAAALADLIQRPWDDSRPAVTAHLHVVATLAALAGNSTEAGEVNGASITAAHLRELLVQLDALGLRTPAGGTTTVGVTDEGGVLLAATTLREVRLLARRGCAAHSDGNCRCPVLGRPPEVDVYSPSTAQDLFVHTRDRTCRFPNCGQRVGWADLDHVAPHACGGATDCANLCCLCRSHHRLKTFARGWRFEMTPDGVLHVTTPSGVTRTTRPPGMDAASGTSSRPDGDPPIPTEPPQDDDGPPF